MTAYVYFIAAYRDEKFSNWKDAMSFEGKLDVKIGGTKNVKKRLAALQTGCPMKLEVIELVIIKGPFKLAETLYQECYAEKRKNGEWFVLTLDDLLSIKKFIPLVQTIYKQRLEIADLKKKLQSNNIPVKGGSSVEKIDNLIDDLDDLDILIEPTDIDENNRDEGINEQKIAESIPEINPSFEHNDDMIRRFVYYLKQQRPSWTIDKTHITGEELCQYYIAFSGNKLTPQTFGKMLAHRFGNVRDHKKININRLLNKG